MKIFIIFISHFFAWISSPAIASVSAKSCSEIFHQQQDQLASSKTRALIAILDYGIQNNLTSLSSIESLLTDSPDSAYTKATQLQDRAENSSFKAALRQLLKDPDISEHWLLTQGEVTKYLDHKKDSSRSKELSKDSTRTVLTLKTRSFVLPGKSVDSSAWLKRPNGDSLLAVVSSTFGSSSSIFIFNTTNFSHPIEIKGPADVNFFGVEWSVGKLGKISLITNPADHSVRIYDLVDLGNPKIFKVDGAISSSPQYIAGKSGEFLAVNREHSTLVFDINKPLRAPQIFKNESTPSVVPILRLNQKGALEIGVANTVGRFDIYKVGKQKVLAKLDSGVTKDLVGPIMASTATWFNSPNWIKSKHGQEKVVGTVGYFFVVVDRSGHEPTFRFKMKEFRAAPVSVFSTSDGRQLAAVGNGIDGILIFDLDNLSVEPLVLRFDLHGASTSFLPSWYETQEGRIFIASVDYNAKCFIFDLANPNRPIIIPDIKANRKPEWFEDWNGSLSISVLDQSHVLQVVEVLHRSDR